MEARLKHKPGQIQAEAFFFFPVTDLTVWSLFTDETQEFFIDLSWGGVALYIYFEKVLYFKKELMQGSPWLT